MTTPGAYSGAMLATLATTAPGLSCQIGTPERKILDAVAQALSAASINTYLTGSLMDVQTLSGMQLEQFIGLFGFGRLQGTYAKGVVTIELTTPNTTNQDLQLGTQFYTQAGISGVSSPLYFASTQDVVLVAGTFSCEVPVKCTSVGISGNVPPDSITYMGTVLGSSTATNLLAMTGGTDPETDDELRQRFENTFLRNIAGTTDWYINLCLQNSSVKRATAYGPISLYTTQITAPSTSLTLSVTADVEYVWNGMTSCFTNIGQTNEVFYTAGDDYTLSNGTSAVFTRVSTGQILSGTIVDLQFQYTTRCSRNNPTLGILNKVDLFVDGVDPFTVAERTVMPTTTFSVFSTSPYYTGNFERWGTTTPPGVGNTFMRLASVPLVLVPSTITIGTTVYTAGVHYFVVVDITTKAGSMYETSGIEWLSTGPTSGTAMTLNYVYNQTPEILTTVISHQKQICTDVMVHQATYQYITPCLDIMYDPVYNISTVNSAITTRLQTYFDNLGYGAWIHLNNLCLAAMQVNGVINVGVTTIAEDSDGYGILVYQSSGGGTPVIETSDFKLTDSQLAEFLTVQINQLATP
jgi:uncharacterized phage protein gp47/JayE